ncbi:hypothetical protein EON62_04615 [archaeon]|nr:MAG: hypothetical protein EON62_04615 [archaeon]
MDCVVGSGVRLSTTLLLIAGEGVNPAAAVNTEPVGMPPAAANAELTSLEERLLVELSTACAERMRTAGVLASASRRAPSFAAAGACKPVTLKFEAEKSPRAAPLPLRTRAG